MRGLRIGSSRLGNVASGAEPAQNRRVARSLKDGMVEAGNWLFRWRSYLPLLLLPMIVLRLRTFSHLGDGATLDEAWTGWCLTVAMVGVSLRAFTAGYVQAGTSGRSTKNQKAEALNTTGIYSVVRHPLYLGNFLIWMAIASFPHDWSLAVVAILAFALYYERIMLAEEDFLRAKFGPKFEEWARIVPAFIPSFHRWRKPALPFSWSAVLAREYSTLFSVVVAFFLLELAGDSFRGTSPILDSNWMIFIAAGVVFYLTARWMAKHKLISVRRRV